MGLSESRRKKWVCSQDKDQRTPISILHWERDTYRGSQSKYPSGGEIFALLEKICNLPNCNSQFCGIDVTVHGDIHCWKIMTCLVNVKKSSCFFLFFLRAQIGEKCRLDSALYMYSTLPALPCSLLCAFN